MTVRRMLAEEARRREHDRIYRERERAARRIQGAHTERTEGMPPSPRQCKLRAPNA